MKSLISWVRPISVIIALMVSSSVWAVATKTEVIYGSTGGGPGVASFAEEIAISNKDLINTNLNLGRYDESFGVSVIARIQCFGYSRAGSGSSHSIPCFNTGAQGNVHLYTDGNGVEKVRVYYQESLSNPYMVSHRIDYQINLVFVDPDAVVVYDDELVYGASNYFLTGDGQHRFTEVDFASSVARSGTSAIAINTLQDGGYGTHWKLMLFANGASPALTGINLNGKTTISFWARASRTVQLMGAFGTGEDTAVRGFNAMQLTTEYQRFSLDLTGLNLSDINTFMWVYLHKDLNPFNFTGVTVYLDDIVIN